MPGTIHIVYSVDTEGPLYESLEATFERLRESFAIDMEPSTETLIKLQRKEINLNGKEDGVANMLRPDMINYNNTWDKMNIMFETLCSSEFRNEVPDSFGNPYAINWFVMDNVGYEINPRRKTLGFGEVFKEFIKVLKKYGLNQDRLYFHFHPVSFNRVSNRSADNISFTNYLNEIIARRIIDYRWFPAAFRPTGTEHMDMNNWLEQWMPFDLANNNKEHDDNMDAEIKAGRVPNRFIDWRGAPTDWSIYNPSSWDSRKKGSLNRYIARCLSMNGRHTTISNAELEKACDQAKRGKNVLVSVFNHDCRDLVTRVNHFRKMVKRIADRNPGVTFKWDNAVEAFRCVLNLKRKKPPSIKIRLTSNTLFIESDSELWGPQPFLAIKTKEQRYYHDNLIKRENNQWVYVFDHDSLLLETVSMIGIASNDKYGNTAVVTTAENDLMKSKTTYWNVSEQYALAENG